MLYFFLYKLLIFSGDQMSQGIDCLFYFIKIMLFSTPLVLMPFFTSWGQSLPSQPEIGFEVQGQSQMNQIVIPLFKYVGECPSSKNYYGETKAWFTSSTEPPRKGRRVIIRNISRGVSPRTFPFTDRQYNQGRASEGISITVGTSHDNRVFHVINDENTFEYEIREGTSVVERGMFSAEVRKGSTVQEIPRDARVVDKGYCRVSAVLFCPKGEWITGKVRECPDD